METGQTPHLKMDNYGNVTFEDGRWLVEFDNSTDTIEEIKSIVQAVNSHDSLVKQRDELLIAAKYCDEWLAEGINREGVDEILKRIRKAIKNAEKGA